MVEVVGIKNDGNSKAVVVIQGKSRDETQSLSARNTAVHAATFHVGKCGFDKWGDYSYLPEGETKPLTEAEMLVPGAVVAGKGRWWQEIHVRATL